MIKAQINYNINLFIRKKRKDIRVSLLSYSFLTKALAIFYMPDCVSIRLITQTARLGGRGEGRRYQQPSYVYSFCRSLLQRFLPFPALPWHNEPFHQRGNGKYFPFPRSGQYDSLPSRAATAERYKEGGGGGGIYTYH